MARRRRTHSPLIINPTLQLTVIAEVSRRGRGRARLAVSDPDAVRALVASVTGGRRASIPAASRRRLVDDGLLVRPRDVPADVHLVIPLESLDARRRASLPARLKTASGVCVVRGPDLPAGVASATASREPFLPDADLLWVRGTGNGISVPYAIDPRLARDITAAFRKPETSALHAATAARLYAVGALVAPGDASAATRAWRERVRRWRAELRRDDCVALRDLLPAALSQALGQYYRRLELEGYLYDGEMRRQGLPLVQGEPVLEFLAGQLARTVRAITRESVRPSFSPYLRIYDPGAVLERHHDRPVCRWNIDLVVGGDPAPARATAWPLSIAHRGRTRAVRLGQGDAVLYRGTKVSHWRGPHPRGATTAIASLHYGAPPQTP